MRKLLAHKRPKLDGTFCYSLSKMSSFDRVVWVALGEDVEFDRKTEMFRFIQRRKQIRSSDADFIVSSRFGYTLNDLFRLGACRELDESPKPSPVGISPVIHTFVTHKFKHYLGFAVVSGKGYIYSNVYRNYYNALRKKLWTGFLVAFLDYGDLSDCRIGTDVSDSNCKIIQKGLEDERRVKVIRVDNFYFRISGSLPDGYEELSHGERIRDIRHDEHFIYDPYNVLQK
ncbi:hypothetical protein LLE49_08985 [Alicyclobacillus tolerans]|uniref:hypothetical protein n=1 Tax=Alicyclobacillus tolerans TaxID=90970 RepID=UPI001F455DE0|nr:hypothetical protein [Alicyclobacillus tolerans]MCF8564851.1 hypothetical protein [Alicyclobacillus tolerans]